MASLNRWTGIGYLGNAPEVQYLPSGDPVTKFSIACQESWKDSNGEKREHTEWINIVCFKKLAEICGQYLEKGSLVYVEGKIQTRSWDDKDGNKKFKTEILINTMKMLDKKKGNGRGEVEPVDSDVPF